MLSNLKQTITKALNFWDKGMHLCYLADYEGVVVNFSKTTLIDLERGEY